MSDKKQHFAKYENSQFHVTKDGHTMTTFDIAKELNRKSFLEKDKLELEAKLDKCHQVLSDIYNGGFKLDEYANPVRNVLGLESI